MGNKSAKPITQAQIDRIIGEVLLNVKFMLSKKVDIFKSFESKLLENITAGSYTIDNLPMKGEMGVHHFKAVQAYRKVATHLQFMKDNSENVHNALKQPEILQNYTTHINSIIWATPKLGLTAVKEFNRMIVEQFGIEYVKQAHHGINVDKTLMPLVIYKGIKEFEKAMYLESFIQRHSKIPNNKCYMLREYINKVKTQKLIQNDWEKQQGLQSQSAMNSNSQGFNNRASYQQNQSPKFNFSRSNTSQSSTDNFQNSLNQGKNISTPNQKLESFLGHQGFSFGNMNMNQQMGGQQGFGMPGPRNASRSAFNLNSTSNYGASQGKFSLILLVSNISILN